MNFPRNTPPLAEAGSGPSERKDPRGEATTAPPSGALRRPYEPSYVPVSSLRALLVGIEEGTNPPGVRA